jgi:hypothetical protein
MEEFARRDGRGYQDEMVVEICYKKGRALRVSQCYLATQHQPQQPLLHSKPRA